MPIFIKTLGGLTIELNVKNDETIANVKKKISDRVGIPPDQQWLFYGGKILEEYSTLSYYNIQEGSSLHLSVKRGGTGDAELAEPTTDASATKSQQYWKEKAKRYDFDEDLYIIDPQSYFHMLRQLERDLVQRSEYMRSGESYSKSSDFSGYYEGLRVEANINATPEIPTWLKEEIIELVPLSKVSSFAAEGSIFEE